MGNRRRYSRDADWPFYQYIMNGFFWQPQTTFVPGCFGEGVRRGYGKKLCIKNTVAGKTAAFLLFKENLKKLGQNAGARHVFHNIIQCFPGCKQRKPYVICPEKGFDFSLQWIFLL